MSNRTLIILAAALIVAAFSVGYGSSPASTSSAAVGDTLDPVTAARKANTDRRIIRTVRCLVKAGTPPSHINRQVQRLYDETAPQ